MAKKSDMKVVEEVNMDIPPHEVEQEQPQDNRQICGLKCAGMEELICYLEKDDAGGRYQISNPAIIRYIPTEGNPNKMKIAFIPQSPASTGILFVPYAKLEYIYQPKEELVREWVTKFTHTDVTSMKKKPKFQG